MKTKNITKTQTPISNRIHLFRTSQQLKIPGQFDHPRMQDHLGN